MNSSFSQTKQQEKGGGPYKVMVVDDSAVIRGFICRYLTEDPEIDVVCTASNGKMAVNQLADQDVEVVVLDIEMPIMDGMTALPKLIEKKPDIQVVMASTLTRKNAEVSLRALQMGAMDYVPKPETARSVNASIDFRRDLVEKVKAWAARRRKKLNIDLPQSGAASSDQGKSGFVRPSATRPTSGFVSAARKPAAKSFGATSARAGSASTSASPAAAAGKAPVIRAAGRSKPKILAIGSSTGGPQALMKFFKGFTRQPSVPIVITQHMPATFTAILADHLGQSTGWPSSEAKEGDVLQPGHIYVAPGDWHMLIEAEAGKHVVRLNQGPQENFCRPSVDPMYRSLQKIFKDKVLAVILTGMGHDGLKGGRDLVKEGATLIAQDEESSVVWGMPGAVANAGLCSFIMPIDDLGKQAEKQLQGGF